MKCCRETQLPALVGSDFNYTHRQDDILGNLSKKFTFGRGFIRIPDIEIDYICCVAPNDIPTELSFDTVPDAMDIYDMANP